MMFGGMSVHEARARARARRERGYSQGHGGGGAGGERSMLQLLMLLPLLLALLSSLTSSGGRRDQLFSFSKRAPYVQQRFTSKGFLDKKIEYFVKSSFKGDLKDRGMRLKELDSNVQNAYVRRIQQECQYDQARRRQEINHARFYGNRRRVKELREWQPDSCQELHSLSSKIGG